MEAIKTTTNRIHPLMAAAAASVIIVSLAGTAAITGVLPSSHSEPAPQAMPMTTSQAVLAPNYAAAQTPAPVAYAQAMQTLQAAQPAQPVQGAYAQPVSAMYAQPAAAQVAAAAPAPAPVVIKETIIKEVPAKHTTSRARTVHTNYARNDGYYAPAPRPVPQPNYVAIGTGAVVGGLLGNQVGSGNGRKLATVAGIIGGGYLGNQFANQNR